MTEYDWEREKPDPEQLYVLVRFVEDFDRRFVGTDLRIYGPFEKGELVGVPILIHKVLEKQELAEKV